MCKLQLVASASLSLCFLAYRIIMINRNGREKEEMGEKMMLMLLEKRKAGRGGGGKGRRRERKEDGKWEREEKGEEQEEEEETVSVGLLWVLNDIMFVKFPTQVWHKSSNHLRQ